jgi:TolB-like protein
MATTYILGRFRLDAEASILFRGTEPVALGQRAVALLRALVEQPGIPVSKDALITAAWPGITVEESNLTVQISALRRVFGEEPGCEDWIETLPRRGYRFIGPVSVKDGGDSVGASQVSNVPTATGAPGLAPPIQPSIAVLPFQNMSGDPEQIYFSDGISEDIITELSRFRNLHVVARNSSFQYRDTAIDARRVARELGVQYLVEGSIRKAGDRLRISAQLVDASLGNHLWADRYDRPLDDIFAVQDEVVQSIVARLEGRLAASAAEQARRKPTEHLGAYDCVLQARAHLSSHGATTAEPLLLRAIELDPGYAQAYAWLARTCVIKFFFDSRPELLDQALEHGRMATRLAENDGICHWARANAHLFRREFEQAAAHFDRARALNPNDVLIFSTYCHFLSRVGRADEALQGLDDILLRDPFPQGWYWEIRALALIQSDRFEEAIQAIRRMPELFVWEYACLAGCYAQLERFDEARAEAAMTLRVMPGFSIRWLLLQEPFKNPGDSEWFMEFLRKAGLPE